MWSKNKNSSVLSFSLVETRTLTAFVVLTGSFSVARKTPFSVDDCIRVKRDCAQSKKGFFSQTVKAGRKFPGDKRVGLKILSNPICEFRLERSLFCRIFLVV